MVEKKFIVIISLLALTGGPLVRCSRTASESETRFPEQRKIFWGSPQERLQSTRWDYGSTTISNEVRLELYRKAITDIGGGYVGVGSTQNFLLAAWANSRWIWLMDFTRIVVAANKVHVAFIKESETPEKYLQLWNRRQAREAEKLIKKYYGGEPDYRFIRASGYRKARRFVNKRFRLLRKLSKTYRQNIWLNDQKLYDRIRNLALQDRIRLLKGDLNGRTTLYNVGVAARKMGVPVRILYLSNAEEYKIFRPYSANYRRNIGSLPVDERSMVLRTISISKWKYPWASGWKVQDEQVGFHYNVQSLADYQNQLKANPANSVVTMLQKADIAGKSGYSQILKKASGSPRRD